MSCLIVSDQIRVQLNDRDVALPADEVVSSGKYTGQNSALQHPEMSRMRLSAMLRRSGAAQVDGARLTWSTMLGRRMAECANSNQ